MDIFTWSIPFVAEKITEMLYHVVSAAEDEDDEKDDKIDANLAKTIEKHAE